MVQYRFFFFLQFDVVLVTTNMLLHNATVQNITSDSSAMSWESCIDHYVIIFTQNAARALRLGVGLVSLTTYRIYSNTTGIYD